MLIKEIAIPTIISVIVVLLALVGFYFYIKNDTEKPAPNNGVFTDITLGNTNLDENLLKSILKDVSTLKATQGTYLTSNDIQQAVNNYHKGTLTPELSNYVKTVYLADQLQRYYKTGEVDEKIKAGLDSLRNGLTSYVTNGYITEVLKGYLKSIDLPNAVDAYIKQDNTSLKTLLTSYYTKQDMDARIGKFPSGRTSSLADLIGDFDPAAGSLDTRINDLSTRIRNSGLGFTAKEVNRIKGLFQIENKDITTSFNFDKTSTSVKGTVDDAVRACRERGPSCVGFTYDKPTSSYTLKKLTPLANAKFFAFDRATSTWAPVKFDMDLNVRALNGNMGITKSTESDVKATCVNTLGCDMVTWSNGKAFPKALITNNKVDTYFMI